MAIKTLKENVSHGQVQLEALKELLTKVSRSSNNAGKDVLNKEASEIEEKWKSYLETLKTVESALDKTLVQWKQFEEGLQLHSQWFRQMEATFRDQQLQASCEDKEKTLNNFVKHRGIVVERENQMDQFLDQANILLHCCQVERIKPLVAQLSNRYQLLHVLSKEVINRWQGLVDDNRSYEEKFKEVSNWLDSLEEHLQAVNRETNVEAKANHLQLLSGEREQGAHRLSTLTSLGERLYPDTAAQGREKIRQELRELRERWDKLEEEIKEQQKKQYSQSQQWTTYQDTLQQTIAWLDTMEKTLLGEQPTWSSLPETRSRLLKLKTSLQDVLSHKRIIEAISEKSQLLSQSSLVPNIEELTETVATINHRYEDLVNNLLVTITNMEDAVNCFQQFQNLLKSQQDWQKQMWGTLSVYTDCSGSKSAVETRLEKISEIQDTLSEGQMLLTIISSQLEGPGAQLPVRAKEVATKELNNLKFEYNKFCNSVSEVKHSLEERLQQWLTYENTMDRLISWLNESEATLKNYTPRSTLEEKESQLERYQALMHSLKQNEPEFDKISDNSSDLSERSGEARISVSVQQITTRFQSIQVTAKEILKKCEQATETHRVYLEKYQQCSSWLAAAQDRFTKCSEAVGSRMDLSDRLTTMRDLITEKTNAIALLNTTVELGEKCYPSTAVEGREAIRLHLQDLQQALETLYDGVASAERELQAKLNRWSGYDECRDQLAKWLDEVESDLPSELQLHATLDEKRAQLQSYRSVLHSVVGHQQDIVDLKDKAAMLPESSTQVDNFLQTAAQRHASMLKRVQDYVEKYEAIVSDHQQYTKSVMDIIEWLDATHNSVHLWGDDTLERITIHSNLERLKALQLSLPDDKGRINEVKTLGEKVLPGTNESGQGNIRSQIDSTQQECQGLLSSIESTISNLETKLQQWNEFESLKDQCMTWIRETDTKLHAVDLKPTLPEKKEQLDTLKVLQGEVRAKELEIDALTERAQQLYKSTLSSRTSQISQISIKYQQVNHKVKDLTAKWHLYVNSHQEFESQLQECQRWLDDIKEKLAYCSDLSASSQKDLEAKLGTIQDLLLYKEEGFSKVQLAVEAAQVVLANTASSGHEPINKALEKLQEDWSSLASRMVETKANLDECIHCWSGFLEQIHQLTKTMDYIETAYNEIAEYQASISEKRAQLERIKSLEEKVKCEKLEVDNLKVKANEMMASGQQSHAASQAQEVLKKFDAMADKIKSALSRWEDYSESKNKLQQWIKEMQNILNKTPDSKGELGEMKTLIERYKHVQGEIDSKKSDVSHLTTEATELSVWTGNKLLLKEARKLQSDYEELSEKCFEIHALLSAEMQEYTDYHQALQDTEKWLLQISFQLMSHNSLYITNREQTQEQISQHEALLEEIREYQSSIDEVNSKGHQQVQRYVATTPEIKNTIEKQLRNVQESYNSLLSTGIQIKNRLLESLAKFQEYEDTLENIMKNLEMWEPQIVTELETPVENLLAASKLLQSVRGIHNKLQGEKTRLAVAIQACEAATASISRPSSPQDTMAQPIPDRELAVRIKLEDLIDQVQGRLESLTSMVNDLDDIKRNKNAIQKWATEKENQLRDLKSRPAKLRPDAAQFELSQLQDLRDAIAEKQAVIRDLEERETSLIPSISYVDIKDQVDRLEKEVNGLMDSKFNTQRVVEGYRAMNQDLNNWMDQLIRKLEALDKGAGMTYGQKVDKVRGISDEFDGNKPSLDALKTRAAEVMQEVGNLDAQQIEEQLKATDRRWNDLQKRIARKAQMLESAKKGFDSTKQEIEQAREWTRGKLALLNADQPMGFDSKEADNKLFGMKSLQKEVDAKQVLIDSFEKRVNNMKPELESSECQELDSSLASLRNEHDELRQTLKDSLNKLSCSSETRKKFESDLEQGQHWLKNKQGEVIETETLPLRAADVQKDMNKYKKLESEIGDFMDNQLTDLKKQGNLLMKDCDGTDKERLKKLIADLEKGVSKLLDKVQEKIISLEHVLEARKDYEKNLDKCRQWLHQAEVSTSSDVKDPSNASTLHEQLAKYEKLGKEAHHMTTTITDTVKQGQALIPQLSEADRLILQEELSSLAQKHGRLAGTIGDKMGQLKGNIEKQQEVSKAMQESMRFVEGIHNDIEALNRPVGSKIEDVQGVLENYEKILDDLKKYKQKLEGLQGQPLANTADLKAMIIQQDDLIAMIEGQISRLRHLLLLQQQFLALVGEITNFIMKYTEIVKEIEKSGRTVEEKIRKYDDVILKIQECEALLASAVDKGQQIAAEGFVADKNAITEQLQSLKQQLQQLRRAVEKKREEHEMTAAEYRKMAEELEIAMDWLQQNEVVIKACPLLERSVYYVKEEMKKHKELESSVQAHLLKIQSIHDSLKHEDCLPTSLSEKLSESKVLLDSLPKALEERANYLSAQLLIREQFAILVNKLKRWTDEARSKVKDIEDRKEDFDNIEKELSDHKTFFASEPDMKELLQNIRQTADKMWPSLKSTEQEGLSHDLEEQNELLNNTLNLARSREAQLEQNVAIWKDYLELLEQCNNLLLHTEVHEEIVATLAGVRCNIQKVEIALKEVEKNQEKIDFLTDKSEDVIKQANESSKNTIKKNVESVKAKWKELVEHLEKQHLDLADLARKWEDFESKWLSFETALVNCEEKAHHADVIIRSLQQGNEIKQTLQSILEETQLLSGELAALTSMANTVLSYLHTNAQPAWEALNTKLDKLGTSHKKLIESLHHKLDKLGKALVKLQQVKEETKQSEERLKSLLLDLQNINVFDADQDKVEKDLKDLKPKIEAAVSSAKSLTVKNRDYFLNLQQLVPSDITQELSTLELLSETVAHAMEERERDAKRARTVRHEYGTDVDELQNWLQHASAKLQDCSVEPQALKEDLIQIQNEIGTIADKLDRATRNGQIIQEKTQNPEEKVLVQDTVTNLTERLQQVRNWLEERKLQIASSLDSWQNFVQLLSAVKAWVEEKNKFLTEPLELSNLTHAKQRCQDYANAVKSCKHVTKQLSDMGKELERIAEVSSVGPLAEKMTEAEEMKSDVESQLMERSALLQETTEEWEQCEKKVKDVRTWIDKSRLNLDSPLNKKKPLRDQLALREKIISDITIQKTKITISIEKLKVHFRAGVCGDSQVTANGEELLLELNKLIGEVKEQMGILEACLAKVDNYQQEIQDLRQKMSEEEQQLRLVSSPTYSPQDREKANSEQNACREHIKGIQAKITALNERIKLLIQRGTPELEPLDT